MPRNGSGVYSLPAGNPVVPATIIATTWANPTLDDIAQALTDSLDRNGLGGMLSPFRIADGSLGAPGLAFTNETGLGLWRSAANTFQLTSNGANIATVNGASFISLLKLIHYGLSTYLDLGEINWKVANEGGVLKFIPSLTADTDDWVTAKQVTLDADGNLLVQGTITSVGGLFADAMEIATLSVTLDLDVTGTFSHTGSQAELNGGILTPQIELVPGIATVSGATNLDWAVSQSHLWTVSGATVVTPINVPVGNMVRVAFNTTNAGAVTWSASVKWPGGTPPDLASGTLKKALVALEYDGTHYLASASVY